MKDIKKQLNGWIYIHYYNKKYNNKLLVIGLLRRFLGFKWFWYVNIK